MPIEEGLYGSVTRAVDTQHLAQALESGDVPVLATPMVIAWCEAATVEAVRHHLGPDDTTVGMRIRVDHLAPTAEGVSVSATAKLTKVEGRRLTFDVAMTDEHGTPVATGQIVRITVDRHRFLAKL